MSNHGKIYHRQQLKEVSKFEISYNLYIQYTDSSDDNS